MRLFLKGGTGFRFGSVEAYEELATLLGLTAPEDDQATKICFRDGGPERILPIAQFARLLDRERSHASCDRIGPLPTLITGHPSGSHALG